MSLEQVRFSENSVVFNAIYFGIFLFCFGYCIKTVEILDLCVLLNVEIDMERKPRKWLCWMTGTVPDAEAFAIAVAACK